MTSIRRLLWPKSLVGKAGVFGLIFLLIFVGAFFAADYFTKRRLAEAWKLCERHGLSNDFDATEIELYFICRGLRRVSDLSARARRQRLSFCVWLLDLSIRFGE